MNGDSALLSCSVRAYFQSYLKLAKVSMVPFVIMTGLAGYLFGLQIEDAISYLDIALLTLGVGCLSAGSFALNQVQEVELDSTMPRTSKRPLPRREISMVSATVFSVVMIIIGEFFLFFGHHKSALLGALTVLFYNGFYTLWWKKASPYGAVPGAIPGAMPVLIGYSMVRGSFLTAEAGYLFLIMFVWQMPHFWTIAIHYVEDYRKGMVPVLPAARGIPDTLYQMGLYTFLYSGLALSAPWIVPVSYGYGILVIPMALCLVVTYFIYSKTSAKKYWLPYFISVNLSIFIFLIVPVVDKWSLILKEMSY